MKETKINSKRIVLNPAILVLIIVLLAGGAVVIGYSVYSANKSAEASTASVLNDEYQIGASIQDDVEDMIVNYFYENDLESLLSSDDMDKITEAIMDRVQANLSEQPFTDSQEEYVRSLVSAAVVKAITNLNQREALMQGDANDILTAEFYDYIDGKLKTVSSSATAVTDNSSLIKQIEDAVAQEEAIRAQKDTALESQMQQGNTKLSEEMASNKAATDAVITQNKSETDALIDRNKTETDALINSNKETTDALIAQNRAQTDATIAQNKSETDAAIATNSATIARNKTETDTSIAQNRSELDASIAQNRSETDASISQNRSELDEVIARNKTETDATIAQNKAAADASIAQNRAETDASIAQNRSETDASIAANRTEAINMIESTNNSLTTLVNNTNDALTTLVDNTNQELSTLVNNTKTDLINRQTTLHNTINSQLGGHSIVILSQAQYNTLASGGSVTLTIKDTNNQDMEVTLNGLDSDAIYFITQN